MDPAADPDAPGPTTPSPVDDAPSPRRWFLRAVVVVVVGLLVAEVGARAVADHLPSSGDDGRQELSRKQARLEELAEQGGVEVVFFGNSTIDAGIDPPRVVQASQQVAGPAYNAALLGAPMYLQDQWIDEVAGGAASPEVAVVGFGPLDVVDWANPVGDGADPLSPAQQRLFEGLVTDNLAELDDDWLSEVDRTSSDWSVLLEHRGALREPAVVLGATFQAATGREPSADLDRTDARWDENLSADGQVQQFLDRQGAAIEGIGGDFLHRSLETSARPERIEGVVDAFAEHDVPVVLLVAPVDLGRLPQASAQAYVELAAEIVAEADELGVPVVDISQAAYGPELYADGIHLNAAGSARFSDDVAVALDALCRRDDALRCGT